MSLVFIENNQPQFGAGLQKAETASQITYGQGTVDDALSQLNNDIAELKNKGLKYRQYDNKTFGASNGLVNLNLNTSQVRILNITAIGSTYRITSYLNTDGMWFATCDDAKGKSVTFVIEYYEV